MFICFVTIYMKHPVDYSRSSSSLGKLSTKNMWLKYEFFPKASDPPPHFWNFRGTFFTFFQNYLTKISKKNFNCFKPFGTLAFVCF